MSTNRREFLKQSGGLILAGWAGATGLTAVAEATSPHSSVALPSRDADSVERWLLETGRHRIDEDVYRTVLTGKA